jgi:hypothetical protein
VWEQRGRRRKKNEWNSNKPRDIPEIFLEHFKSAYSSSCPGTFPFIHQFTEVLSLSPISNSDVHNAIK